MSTKVSAIDEFSDIIVTERVFEDDYYIEHQLMILFIDTIKILRPELKVKIQPREESSISNTLSVQLLNSNLKLTE